MGIKPLTGKLVVDVEVFPPDNRRRDIDNVQKALLDALEHGAHTVTTARSQNSPLKNVSELKVAGLL